MNKLRRGLTVLRLRGPRYLVYLISGYALPRIWYQFVYEVQLQQYWRRLTFVAAGLVLLAVGLIFSHFGASAALLLLFLVAVLALTGTILSKRLPQRLQVRRARSLVNPDRSEINSWASWASWDVAPDTRQRVESARASAADGEIILGHIDADGRLLSHWGELPCFDAVDRTQFAATRRYGLDLVLIGERILIRKDFRGDRRAFAREWLSLATLQGSNHVPSVSKVDQKRLVIYKDFVPGRTLRRLLVDAGARILTVQTSGDPELQRLPSQSRLEAVWARGRQVFDKCLPTAFVESLADIMDDIHRRGVTGFSLTFGNVVLGEKTDEPWLIDFDSGRTHRSTRSRQFRYYRDHDRRLFNRIYGQSLLTERSARTVLPKVQSSAYSPVDLGAGIATDGFWSVDSGTGRWQYLNGKVLNDTINGARVLDLGTHNAAMPLMMLRAGAREVLAIEHSPEAVEAARHLKELFEWYDLRNYRLTVRCADMLDLLDQNFGRFDVVTAFCSLYYVDEESMRRLVRRIAGMAPIIVLQAKTDTRPDAPERKNVKSSLAFTRQLLVENGFPRIHVLAPKGYNRPLVIGRTIPI